MSGQKPLHFLRATRFWPVVQQFLDGVDETLSFPKSVTAAERDQIRQICKHFDVTFKVHGEGAEKYMEIRRPDFSYLEAAEEQQQTLLLTDRTEVHRLQQLVLQLSKDVNIERIKLSTLLHKLHSESEREAAMNELKFIESEKSAICAVCGLREIVKMSDACGHSCCSECFDVARCPICEKEVDHVVLISASDTFKTEQDIIDPTSSRSKRIRM